MQKEIQLVVKKQEEYDLDVLVHGEPERNDMVEYFGELLDGFAFTQYGSKVTVLAVSTHRLSMAMLSDLIH